jgi:hypothetical protein
MRMRTMCAAIAAFVALAVAVSRADTVYVGSSAGHGQGWRFPDAGACWVATAQHVVGQAASAIIKAADGSAVQGSVVISSTETDLALLRVSGPCPPASLGDLDERPLLESVMRENDSSLRFEYVVPPTGGSESGSLGLHSIPVLIIAMDGHAPTFTIRPQTPNPNIRLLGGDSGAPVILHDHEIGLSAVPLGIMSEVRSGIGIMVRMDEVRKMLAHAEASTTDDRARTVTGARGVRSWGDTRDPACGPGTLETPSSPCGWRVWKTDHNPIAIDLDFGNQAREITAIEVRFVSGDARGIEVLSSLQSEPPEEAWGDERYCNVQRGGGYVNCTLAPRLVRAVRIRFDASHVEVRAIRIVAP